MFFIILGPWSPSDKGSNKTKKFGHIHTCYSPGALEFDPEKNSTKLIFSGYVQNISRNKISKVPKFPPCAKFFTAIFKNGRLFGRKLLFYFISNQTTLYNLSQS